MITKKYALIATIFDAQYFLYNKEKQSAESPVTIEQTYKILTGTMTYVGPLHFSDFTGYEDRILAEFDNAEELKELFPEEFL